MWLLSKEGGVTLKVQLLRRLHGIAPVLVASWHFRAGQTLTFDFTSLDETGIYKQMRDFTSPSSTSEREGQSVFVAGFVKDESIVLWWVS